jgi:hypothetical protein
MAYCGMVSAVNNGLLLRWIKTATESPAGASFTSFAS